MNDMHGCTHIAGAGSAEAMTYMDVLISRAQGAQKR